MTTTIPAVAFVQGGATVYLGYVPAKDLIPLYYVDRFDPEEDWDINKKGYQRDLFPDHIREIGDFLRDKPDPLLPVPIIARADYQDNWQFTYEDGSLILQAGAKLVIIDGQHRLRAIDVQLAEDSEHPAGELLLPIVILDGISKVEELRQFFLINSRQRRIQANLAFALIGVASQDDPTVASSLTRKGEAWKLPATAVAIRLNETAGTHWSGRVRYPGDDPKIVNLNSLANSVEKFFKNRDQIAPAVDEVVSFLGAFWDAVAVLMPRVFQAPSGYIAQRGVGTTALHHLAYEIYRQRSNLRQGNSQGIHTLLAGATDYFDPDNWKRGGKYAKENLGASRPKALAREILQSLGLEPRWPPGQVPQTG